MARYAHILLFILLLVPAYHHAQAENAGYVLGTVSTDIPAVMVHRIEPLTRYLSAQIGSPITLRPSPHMSAAIEDFGRGTTQIAYLTPVAYIEARERFGAVAVALPLSDDKPYFRLAIVAHKDGPVHKLADLNGHSFALGDEKSLLQRATLEAAGLKIDQFSRYAYLKHFDNVAKAIINKDFDAGILTYVRHSRVGGNLGKMVLIVSGTNKYSL